LSFPKQYRALWSQQQPEYVHTSPVRGITNQCPIITNHPPLQKSNGGGLPQISVFWHNLPDYLGRFFIETSSQLLALLSLWLRWIASQGSPDGIDYSDDIPLLAPTFELLGYWSGLLALFTQDVKPGADWRVSTAQTTSSW